MRVCDRNCMKCIFPDCICNDISLKEWTASEEIDSQIKREREKKGECFKRSDVPEILGFSYRDNPKRYRYEYDKKIRSLTNETRLSYQRAYSYEISKKNIKEIYNLNEKYGYIQCLIDILRGMDYEEGEKESEYMQGYNRMRETVIMILEAELERIEGE